MIKGSSCIVVHDPQVQHDSSAANPRSCRAGCNPSAAVVVGALQVTVITGTGEWKLHSLLLASRSEFFYRALAGQFAESKSKRIELHLEKAPGEEVRAKQLQGRTPW